MTPEEAELERVPEEFRSVISSMAYDRGHSAGRDEVLLYIRNYVHELQPAIHAFEIRLLREGAKGR
jgi:hypothetical protein